MLKISKTKKNAAYHYRIICTKDTESGNIESRGDETAVKGNRNFGEFGKKM